MSEGYISYFTNSAYFSDSDLQNLLPDLQSQVSNEFNYYWGFCAYLDDSGGGEPVFVTDWGGDPTQAPGLGYHTIDNNCNPYAIVYGDVSNYYGVPVSGVISHETLEMLADEKTDTTNLYDNGDGTGYIILQEVCDPCELNLYYEGPNSNLVSDFVTPNWYMPGCPGPYDFLGAIPNAWQLASGGYVCYQNVSLSGWICPTGDEARKIVAAAAKTIKKIDNPMAASIGQLRSKGRKVQTLKSGQQQVTIVKRKDVPKIAGLRQAPREMLQPPAMAGRAPFKAQRLPEKV